MQDLTNLVRCYLNSKRWLTACRTMFDQQKHQYYCLSQYRRWALRLRRTSKCENEKQCFREKCFVISKIV